MFKKLFFTLKIKTKSTYFFLFLAIILSSIIRPIPPTKATSCPDFQIIFARGSGEPLNGSNYQAWVNALSSELESFLAKEQLQFTELGTSKNSPFIYPATSLDNPFVAAGTFFRTSHHFLRSLLLGINELKHTIKQKSASCPDTKFILGGYSQGAAVLIKALPDLNPNRIFYLATFGDPYLFLPEGYGINPPACQKNKFSSYRRFAPDCRTKSGILGIQIPYEPKNFANKVGLWCNLNDPICGSKLSFKKMLSPHTNYIKDQLYQDAATFIADLIKESQSPSSSSAFVPIGGNINPTSPNQNPTNGTFIQSTQKFDKHNLAIVFDLTGSMSPLLSKYQSEAIQYIEKFYDNKNKIALYGYRDLKDPFKPKRLCHKDCTKNELINTIKNLKVDDGGDEPESALNAIMFALNDFTWQKDAKKSLILITDAPFHDPDHDGTTHSQIIKKSLEIDPVNIFVIAPPEMSSSYLHLTQKTGGNFFNSNQEIIHSTNFISNRPVALFKQHTYHNYVNQKITFAAKSHQPNMRYQWDLNGDGIFETHTNIPTVSATYPKPIETFVQLKIIDQNNFFSTASARLVIDEPPEPIPASIHITNHQRQNSNLIIDFSPSPQTKALILSSKSGAFSLINPLPKNHQLNIQSVLDADEIYLTPVSHFGYYGKRITIKITPNHIEFIDQEPNIISLNSQLETESTFYKSQSNIQTLHQQTHSIKQKPQLKSPNPITLKSSHLISPNTGSAS